MYYEDRIFLTNMILATSNPNHQITRQSAAPPFCATSFEHYMYADDRVDLPMNFFIRFSFSGTLHLKRFESALLKVLPGQLLFQSLLNGESRTRAGKLKWIPLSTTQLPYIDVEPIGVPIDWSKTSRHIDLQMEIGLRFFIRTGNEKTIVTMQIHHSCSDAIGALEFFEEVMKHYHSRAGKTKSVTHKQFEGREFHLSVKEKILRSKHDMSRAYKFISNSPLPLDSGSPPDEFAFRRNSAHLSSKTVLLEKEDVRRLKKRAGDNNVTLNDLFLSELFVTIAHFNPEKSNESDCFRIAMPINMRTISHAGLPSANIVSICCLDRLRKSITDEKQFVAGIADETREIKKNQLGLALLRTMKRFSRYTGGLDLLVAPRKPFMCCATVVLSNLGKVFDNSDVFDQFLSPVLDSRTPSTYSSAYSCGSWCRNFQRQVIDLDALQQSQNQRRLC